MIDLATPVMMFRPAFLALSNAGLPVNSADTLRRLAGDKGRPDPAPRGTGCGLCAEFRPTGAIRMEAALPQVDTGACLGCCACFNRCPTQAWRLHRFAPKHFYPGPSR